jgi:ribonuclease HI
MSSTRTEMCGLFAALTHLRLVVEYFHIIPKETASCRIYCDSKAALARVDDKYYDDFGTTWRCRRHYDLEVAIRTCLLQLPIKIEWQWVRGHASRRKKEQDFTYPEVLNECADDLATLARQSPIRTQQDEAHWPEQTISIIGPRGRMCGRLASELRYCCTAGDMLSYWQGRFDWSSSQVALLDLIGTRQALSNLAPAPKQRIQKLRCGWLPVNRRESRIDPDRENGCKACSPGNLVEETVDHILQCTCQIRRHAMRDRFDGMTKTFRSWKTSTFVINALRSGAWAWIEDNPPPNVETLNLPDSPLGQLVHKAYVEQTSLGWNLLFRGFWTTSWRTAQEYEFSNSIHNRGFTDNGENWAGRAQTWMFDLFELAWGLRNADEHGEDLETQRMIQLAKAERAIRRLYREGDSLPTYDRFPFNDPMEDILTKTVSSQERWITKTEAFLPKALRRIKERRKKRNHSIKKYFGTVT